jgi:hypothetical protein
MLGPSRRWHAAQCSTVTSQLVPSVMICAWNFFSVKARGRDEKSSDICLYSRCEKERKKERKKETCKKKDQSFEGAVTKQHAVNLATE